MDEWLSTQKTLPALDEKVLTTCVNEHGGRYVRENALIRSTNANLLIWIYGESVTAWMPLPHPYDEDAT